MSAPQRLERLAFNKLTRAAKTATAAQVSLCGGVLVKGNSCSFGESSGHDTELKRLVFKIANRGL
jgi:hypothetical protein